LQLPFGCNSTSSREKPKKNANFSVLKINCLYQKDREHVVVNFQAVLEVNSEEFCQKTSFFHCRPLSKVGILSIVLETSTHTTSQSKLVRSSTQSTNFNIWDSNNLLTVNNADILRKVKEQLNFCFISHSKFKSDSYILLNLIPYVCTFISTFNFILCDVRCTVVSKLTGRFFEHIFYWVLYLLEYSLGNRSAPKIKKIKKSKNLSGRGGSVSAACLSYSTLYGGINRPFLLFKEFKLKRIPFFFSYVQDRMTHQGNWQKGVTWYDINVLHMKCCGYCHRRPCHETVIAHPEVTSLLSLPRCQLLHFRKK